MRADATPETGTGHVMRCAALGLRLARSGAKLHFASASMPSALAQWLADRDFELHDLPAMSGDTDETADAVATRAVADQLGGVDLLVVDNYGLGRTWEQGVRPAVGRILAIDDLAREHDCDVLLDQNLRYHAEDRYAGRVPARARQFIGPRFALLRPEFDDTRLVHQRDGKVRHLLVFFGGTDPGNQTLKVIEALRILGKGAPRTTIVLGPAHPDRATVHEMGVGLTAITILDATNEMAKLISVADLAIGACGIAAWERCLLALPSIVVVTAENQREDAEILHQLGALDYLGYSEEVSSTDWARAITLATADPHRLRAMGSAAAVVMDGREAGFAELERAISS